MIDNVIRLVLTNVPAIMFVAALAVAYLRREPKSAPERYLAWMLLLSVGVQGIWAGIFHIFFPGVASGEIGWASSPFEFEMGVTDLSIGIVAVAAFWRSLSFQSAVAAIIVLIYIGVAIGHFIQAYVHHDFSPDNFGLLLVVTLVSIPLLSWLVWAAWRDRKAGPR